jgi:hypothetical protein
MSVRRELSALWSGCDTLRDRMGPLPAQPRPEARRALEVAYEELASALRRLGSARMLTSSQVGELEHAQAGLAAARSGGLPLATAVARYAQALQEVATSFHIRLSPPTPDLASAFAPPGNGSAHRPLPLPIDGVDIAPGEAVEALALVTSMAAEGGHRLGGFSGSGTGDGYRFTARCAVCGDEVSVLRSEQAWSFTPVVPCPRTPAAPAGA